MEGIKVPDTCPHCDVEMGHPHSAYWIVCSDLNYDSDTDEEGLIEDQIWECSACHTLFRLRWKLVGFTELIEKEGG